MTLAVAEAPSTRSSRTSALFAELARAPDPQRRRDLLEQVVLLNRPVAESVASRYASRGIPTDDLRQVACLALVRSSRNFDPARGHDFLSYLVPTVRGEVRRYFRDHGWTVRPPRRVQELQLRIFAVREGLAQMLGRSPRPREIAERLDEPLEDVEEALAADGCFTPASLDRSVTEDGSTTLGDLLGGEDDALAAAEARTVLGPLVSRLRPRDRLVVELRFFEGRTQAEIGQEIGVTQMQVSRLLKRILGELRDGLEGEAAVPASPKRWAPEPRRVAPVLGTATA